MAEARPLKMIYSEPSINFPLVGPFPVMRFSHKVTGFLQRIGVMFLLFFFFPLPLHSEVAQFEPSNLESSVQWKSLFLQTGLFLGAQHSFRLATEAGTRAKLKGPFWQNYLDSIGNLHGWSDGDGFLVNYIGHPMEGAAAGFVFAQNDPKFQRVEFGKNAAYWKGRLRAGAFAWAYSSQFEIGLVSEATIGDIQNYYPQQGFVDHVITPTAGLGWMVAEDLLDKYVIKYIESRSRNATFRLLARSWLNPARSWANLMRLRQPWHRDSRPGVRAYDSSTWKNEYAAGPYSPGRDVALAHSFLPGSDKNTGKARWNDDFRPFPSFELNFHADYMLHSQREAGKGNLFGGGGTAVFGLNRWAGAVIDVSGYKMSSQGPNLSGDSLLYLFGPRFMYRNSGRWSLYLDLLLGGNKLTQEQDFPERLPAEGTSPDWNKLPAEVKFWQYHKQIETNGVAASLGGGFDVALNRALAIRVCNLQYIRSSIKEFALGDYSSQFRFSTGLVLRIGTW